MTAYRSLLDAYRSLLDVPMRNIPIRTEAGRAIRRSFVAAAGDLPLLTVNYAEFELRIIAQQLRPDGSLEPMP